MQYRIKPLVIVSSIAIISIIIIYAEKRTLKTERVALFEDLVARSISFEKHVTFSYARK